MIDVKSIIGDIISEKGKNNVAPLNADFIDIQNKVMEKFKSEMRSMLKSGEIKAYKTLNSTAIELTDR